MSEEEFSAARAEQAPSQEHQFEPMAALSANETSQIQMTKNLKELEESLDGQSYFLGEVPQAQLVDPSAFLPLSSDQLIGAVNVLEKNLTELGLLIQEEVNQIQKLQKRIHFWEDRIEKNKALIQNNLGKIKQNNIDIIYDMKNRDYWWGRSEQVDLDYTGAEAAARVNDWAWLIKKYGLKNADGSEIDPKNPCVEELCNGEIRNLSGKYKTSGNKYEQSKKDREAENNRLIRENSKCMTSNETLQNYIAATYANEIEPLQDGVLLLKELGVKFKSLNQEGAKPTYGELRVWAESFLSDFIKANPRVSQGVVTDFRKLTSIPLPAEHC